MQRSAHRAARNGGAVPLVPTASLQVAFNPRRRITSVFPEGPLIRVRRASDDAELNIPVWRNRLHLGVLFNHLGGVGTGYLVTVGDQSPNNANIQCSGNANQPMIVDAGTLLEGAKFDGSNDAMWIPSNAAFDVGTGDFDHECWVKSTANTGVTIDRNVSSTGFQIELVSGAPRHYINGAYRNTGAVNFNDGAWHHSAGNRISGDSKLWSDGAQDGSTHSGSLNATATGIRFTIGATASGAGPFTGLITDALFYVGAGRYTAAFSPPNRVL